jgi:hypothetical protein
MASDDDDNDGGRALSAPQSTMRLLWRGARRASMVGVSVE